VCSQVAFATILIVPTRLSAVGRFEVPPTPLPLQYALFMPDTHALTTHRHTSLLARTNTRLSCSYMHTHLPARAVLHTLLNVLQADTQALLLHTRTHGCLRIYAHFYLPMHAHMLPVCTVLHVLVNVPLQARAAQAIRSYAIIVSALASLLQCCRLSLSGLLPEVPFNAHFSFHRLLSWQMGTGPLWIMYAFYLVIQAFFFCVSASGGTF